MLRLRPHHIQFLRYHPRPPFANYRHAVELYGENDVLHTLSLSRTLRDNPSTLVELVVGADDVCDACSLRALCDTDHDELMRRDLEILMRIHGPGDGYVIEHRTPHQFDEYAVGMLGPSIAERWRLKALGRWDDPIVESYGGLIAAYAASVKTTKKSKKD
jgi:hypothetical protein